MPTKVEKDAVTGTDTTGHEWDGVKELNTPLPKWWVYTFWATAIWGLAYCLVYPALPGHKGFFGYSQRAEIEKSMGEAKAKLAPRMKQMAETPLADIRRNPDLLRFAQAGGRTLFNDNCATCHGPGGAGNKGYPNLADDDWLWGGKLDEIYQTIREGVRNSSDDSRQSQMPKFGEGGLTQPQISDVADFVLALSGGAGDATAAKRGEPIFGEQCASCHGDKGEGNPEVGAPRLSDKIWLYGGDKKTIVESITYSRAGSMPGWTGRFDDATIKMLAVYVHALGGGK
ncbi:MAG: cytochrome-c oxidase, cbb3-type subunit III [Alphaproteobacteria bacterium]|nr:cytochrome-c oxidase, cbb3-type subunit III [Alphaproteobacteria bacterium]